MNDFYKTAFFALVSALIAGVIAFVQLKGVTWEQMKGYHKDQMQHHDKMRDLEIEHLKEDLAGLRKDFNQALILNRGVLAAFAEGYVSFRNWLEAEKTKPAEGDGG